MIGCSWSNCVPTANPKEVCDGIDNDCDGITDAGAATAACNDGDTCNGIEICTAGKCTAGTAKVCAKKSCQTETCDKSKGCVYSPNNGGTCTGSKCVTQAVCKNGVCGGTAVTCGDGNVCTDNSCDNKLGCVKNNNTASCSDGNACTGKDACAGGTCSGGKSICDDNNACTTDSCNPTGGACTNTAITGCGWKGMHYFLNLFQGTTRTVADLDVAEDGSLYVGVSDAPGKGKKPTGILLKVSTNGKILYDKVHAVGAGFFLRALRIMATKIWISGQAMVNTGSNAQAAYFTRLTTSGQKEWSGERWFPSANVTKYGSAWGLAPAPQGGHFNAGYGLRTNKENFAYITRYDNKDAKVWAVTFGVGKGAINLTGLDADAAGNTYAVGSVRFDLDGTGSQKALGQGDAFLQKRNSAGVLMWTRQWGTTAADWGRKVQIHPDGSIWVLGATAGKLPGKSNLGSRDMFVAQFDSDGKALSGTRQFGSSGDDFGYGMDIDSMGNLLVVGRFGSSGAQLVKLSKTGSVVWQKKWVRGNMVVRLSAVRAMSNDAIVVAGTSNKGLASGLGETLGNGSQVFLLRLNSAGKIFQ